MVELQVNWVHDGSGSREIRVVQNTAEEGRAYFAPHGGYAQSLQRVTAIISASPGDTIHFEAKQTSGANLDIDVLRTFAKIVMVSGD